MAALRARIRAKEQGSSITEGEEQPSAAPTSVMDAGSAQQPAAAGAAQSGPAVDSQLLAVEEAACVFGQQWRERFHRSHRLMYAAPLLYCRVCGHHCETGQHIAKLGEVCDGPPGTGSVYHSRLRSIAAGRHPTGGHALNRAFPLPCGSRG